LATSLAAAPQKNPTRIRGRRRDADGNPPLPQYFDHGQLEASDAHQDEFSTTFLKRIAPSSP
jgi:hypothetical protein